MELERKESHDARLARLDERIQAMSRHLDKISVQLDSINSMQLVMDRTSRQLPEMKSSLQSAHAEIGRIRKGVNHVRWFFMGVGAAFGFLGGAISETVRGVLKLLMEG